MEVMTHRSRRGPAPDHRLDWLHAATAAPSKSLHLALLLLRRSAGKPCPVVSLTRRMMTDEGGISRDACRATRLKSSCSSPAPTSTCGRAEPG